MQRVNFKGTPMQIWKSTHMFVCLEKYNHENTSILNPSDFRVIYA